MADVWQRHRLVVTLEENSIAGGFGAAVLEWAALSGAVGAPQVKLCGIPDKFQEHASRDELLAALKLDAVGIAETVRETVALAGTDVEDAGPQAQSAS